MDSKELEKLNRDQLIARARQLGATRPELLTRPELRDEIIRLSESDETERRRARGWFGVARDLVASVVSQGLNLPDTAELIRGVHVLNPKAAPPVATVTLAEIYAAQGHLKKALDLLDEVIAHEPDHDAARAARARLSKEAGSVSRPAISQAAGSMVDSLAAELQAQAEREALQGTAPSAWYPEASAEGPRATDGAEGATEPANGSTSPAEQLHAGSVRAVSAGEVERVPEVGGATESRPEVERPSNAATQQTEPTPLAEPRPSSANDSVVEPTPLAEPTRSSTDDSMAEPTPLAESTPSSAAGVATASAEPMTASSPAEAVPLPEVVGASASNAPTRDPKLDNSLLIVRPTPAELFCIWQTSPKLVARLREGDSGGALVLRVVEVSASSDGPDTHESDLELAETDGHLRIELKTAPAEVRVALGWIRGERFSVIAIGTEFGWDDSGTCEIRWVPPASNRSDEEHRSATEAVTRMMRTVQAA